MVRRGPVITLPDRVAKPGAGRADICVAVMPVNTPRLQYAVDKALVSRTANVINDLVAAVLYQCGADLGGNIIQHLIPRNLFPFTIAPLPFSPHRIKDAVDIIDLVDGRRPFRTVAAAATRV